MPLIDTFVIELFFLTLEHCGTNQKKKNRQKFQGFSQMELFFINISKEIQFDESRKLAHCHIQN